MEKLKKCDDSYEHIFKENEISIEEAVEDSICKLLEEAGKDPESVNKLNLQDWVVTRYAPITHLKSGVEIWGSSQFIDSILDKKKWGEYWEIFKETLIKLKKEEIIKNPQDWRIERSVNWYGEYVIEVVRKDNEEDRLSKELFTSKEFIEIESKLEGQENGKFWLPLLFLILILLFVFFFFWWYRKKEK